MNCIKIILLDNSTETTTMGSLLSSRSNRSLCLQVFSQRIKSSQTRQQYFSRIIKNRRRESQASMILVNNHHRRNNQRLQILLKMIRDIAKSIKQVRFKSRKLCQRYNKLLTSKSKRISSNIITIIKDKLRMNNLVELTLRRHIVSMIRLRERQRKMRKEIKMKTPAVVLKQALQIIVPAQMIMHRVSITTALIISRTMMSIRLGKKQK